MIAVVFALEFEGAFFRAKHDPRLRVAIWLLGAMGEGAARSLDHKLGENRPSLVISAGFAGGLQPDLAAGDLIIGDNYSDSKILAQLDLANGWRVGGIQTESAIIERAEDKRRLGRETGCLAGDLETAHMAGICARRGLPMLAVRCISDTADEDMPVPAHTLLNPDTGRPDPLRLFRHLIANPSSLTGFNRLLKNARIAQTQLARGLDQLLPRLLQLT